MPKRPMIRCNADHAERRPLRGRTVRAAAALSGLLALVTVAGCTSGTSTTGSSTGSPSTTASGQSQGTQPAPSQTSPTQAETSPAPSTTSPADASAAARALITSAVHLDAAGFQTGSYDPSTPAGSMPGTVQFTTPSKNIRCTMVDTSPTPPSLICTFVHFDFTAPPRPASCHHNWTAYFSLSDASVDLGMCLGGEEVSFASRVLPYGDSIETLGIGCYSSSAALTCLDLSTGHGFIANRSRFVKF